MDSWEKLLLKIGKSTHCLDEEQGREEEVERENMQHAFLQIYIYDLLYVYEYIHIQVCKDIHILSRCLILISDVWKCEVTSNIPFVGWCLHMCVKILTGVLLWKEKGFWGMIHTVGLNLSRRSYHRWDSHSKNTKKCADFHCMFFLK